MGRMPQLVRKSKKDRRLGEPGGRSWEEIEALDLDARVELIRALLPLGLAEVGRILDEEVEQLAGQRHPIRVPRVRDANGEVKLVSYAELHGSSGEAGPSPRNHPPLPCPSLSERYWV